jgi:hypothetical protein
MLPFGLGQSIAQLALEDTMKNFNRIVSPLVAVALIGGAPFTAFAQNQNNNAPAATSTQDWNTPPAGTEQAQQGFRDGIEAAKLDTLAKRKIDAKASHLYVHPPVKGAEAVNVYRQQFETGYNAAVKHGVQIIRANPNS